MELPQVLGALEPAVVVPIVLIFVGALFQVATGVGLGLIAGPGLLFVMPGSGAVQLAVLLNLALTLLVVPFEFRQIEWKVATRISLWALIGIPVGLVLLFSFSQPWLKVTGGTLVVMAALQLRLSKTPLAARLAKAIGMSGGAIAAGVMTGALGMPGPAALWALLNTEMSADRIRAVLRAFFIFAYGTALLLHTVIFGLEPGLFQSFVSLLPVLLAGMAAGQAAKIFIPNQRLHVVLQYLLLVMGLALAVKGIADVVQI